MKIKTFISVIVVILMLFLARTMYSDYNLKKIISACVITKTKSSSVEEAEKICADKLK